MLYSVVAVVFTQKGLISLKSFQGVFNSTMIKIMMGENTGSWKSKVENKHCWFLEHWNRQKSLTNIWQHFSCLLDEKYAKNIFKNWDVISGVF